MKKWKPIRLMAGVQLLLSLAAIGAVVWFAPVCAKLLTLESGTMVAMKCAHAAKLFLMLAGLVGLCAVLMLLQREPKKELAAVMLAGSVLLFCGTFSSAVGIGVCANPAMPCNQTALWMRLCATAIGGLSLAVLLGGPRASKIPQ